MLGHLKLIIKRVIALGKRRNKYKKGQLSIWNSNLVAQLAKKICLQGLETRVQSLDQEDPLEKGLATHSSVLAWRIPRIEQPGGLQSIGSQSQARLSN